LIAKIPGGTIPGDESRPLVPQSQTVFEGLGLGYQFIVDDKGAATDRRRNSHNGALQVRETAVTAATHALAGQAASRY